MKAIRTIIVLGALLLGPLAGASELTVDNLTVTTNADIYGEMNFYALGVMTGTVTATGGTTTESGGYRIHTFTANGTFEISSGSLNCEILVVAGGGGGGNGFAGGGGGGGGVVFLSSYSAGVGVYPVVVGNGGGGAGTASSDYNGTNGGNSSFANIIADGGGGGGSGGDGAGGIGNDGLSGGSGGGGGGEDNSSHPDARGGAGIDGQGYAGGNAFSGGPPYGGGGGGGAGAPGGSAAPNPGLGGNGTNVWGADYGGGGGSGGTYDPANGAPGGLGGGGGGGASGQGDPARNGQDGAPNTGGGGGGGGCGSTSDQGSHGRGGNGGSGIVIVRYPITGTGVLVPTLTISSNGISQVSTSAVNSFMGKVGIGTESPEEKLHVAGDLKVEGALTLGVETRTNWPSTAEGALMSSSNLSDIADVAAARTNLGLGSAATEDASAFDAAGEAATVGSALAAHTSDSNNPHRVTAAQVGALTPTGNGSQLTGITAGQVAGTLIASNNLSDVADVATARNNLGALSAAGGVVNGVISLVAPSGDIPMGVYTNR